MRGSGTSGAHLLWDGFAPLQALEIYEVVIAAICRHRQPRLLDEALAVHSATVDLIRGLSGLLRDQDLTIRPRELAGLPLFYVVPVKKPRVHSLPHVDLEEFPVACIHRLLLVGVFRGQQPQQSVTLLARRMLEFVGGLAAHVVGKNNRLFFGYPNGSAAYAPAEGVALPGVAEGRVGPRATLPVNVHTWLPRRVLQATTAGGSGDGTDCACEACAGAATVELVWPTGGISLITLLCP